MAQKRLWNIAKKRVLEDRGMHEEHFSAFGCGRTWKEEKQKWRG